MQKNGETKVVFRTTPFNKMIYTEKQQKWR